ncbi:MAG: hypothetical protein A3H28_03030 [Acidobacteria bacterium RIFCSPLOWO2_02_FULL_61_28]|nr:MAG: hypothetical protein A3H28_03030 [Acidobacteria bacterium RIFCSPLOWO2_02_FULL_61_28]
MNRKTGAEIIREIQQGSLAGFAFGLPSSLRDSEKRLVCESLATGGVLNKFALLPPDDGLALLVRLTPHDAQREPMVLVVIGHPMTMVQIPGSIEQAQRIRARPVEVLRLSEMEQSTLDELHEKTVVDDEVYANLMRLKIDARADIHGAELTTGMASRS